MLDNSRYNNTMKLVDNLLQKKLGIGSNQVTNLIIDLVVGKKGMSCRKCGMFECEVVLGECRKCFEFKIKKREWNEMVLSRCLLNLLIGYPRYMKIIEPCICCHDRLIVIEKNILRKGINTEGIERYFRNYTESRVEDFTPFYLLFEILNN